MYYVVVLGVDLTIREVRQVGCCCRASFVEREEGVEVQMEFRWISSFLDEVEDGITREEGSNVESTSSWKCTNTH